MSVIFILIFISMVVGGAFLALFIWASRSGQFDDTVTPSIRMLFEDQKRRGQNQKSK
ncbi:MAG: cbb3-type cytochrome oxidase assembly protein CcoS [Bacteroidota bacterium]